MIRLYLVRHGETSWNKDKKFQGWTDIDLNDKGMAQAKALGERFKKIDIDEIYSSPLKRAYGTAIEISKAKGINVNISEHFKEINFGEWEGYNMNQLLEIYGDSFKNFIDDPHNCSFPGDGSFRFVEQRIKKGLESILEGKQNKNILIVSHGGIVRLTIKYLLGFGDDFYMKSWIDNTSISVVDIKSRGNLLMTFNDKSHLIDAMQ